MKKLLFNICALVSIFALSFNVTFAATEAANTNSTTLASASSQFWNITNASQTGLNPGSNSFSISLWIKFTTLPGTNATQGVVGKHDYTSNREYVMYFLHEAGGNWDAEMDTSSSGTGSLSAARLNITAPVVGAWHQYTWSYNTAVGTLTYMMDGVSTGTGGTGGVTSFLNGTQAFEIGSDSVNGLPLLNAQVDRVLYYSTNISAVTDLANFTTPCAPSTTNLVSAWRFNNDGTDSVGSNNLTNNNAATFTTDVAYTCTSATKAPYLPTQWEF